MPRTTRPSQARYDLEEIAPNRFVLHNSQIAGLLKDEGVIEGRFFQLTTWRRDGLIARLRQRSLQVSTLADQIAKLPGLPHPPQLGAAVWRMLATPIERFSSFDLRTLEWQQIEPQQRAGVDGVEVLAGMVLRRRKGRGPASYHLAHAEHGGTLALQPLDETAALLFGYAQAAASGPVVLRAATKGEQATLPQVELPLPYRKALARVTEREGEGLLVAKRNLPLAVALFARLGVTLQA